MKLPFNLGRRRKSDAEDEEDPEFAGDPDDLYDPDDPDRESSTAPPDDRPAAADGEDSEAEPVGGETDAGEDDLEDPADFDDDDDDGARDDKPSRRLWPPPRVAVFATIGVAGVLVVGGIVWWLMGTPDDGMAADHGAPKGPRVVVPLAPKSAAGSLNQLVESKPGNPATPPAGGLTPSPMGLTPSPAGLAPAPAGLAPPPTSPAMTEESAPGQSLDGPSTAMVESPTTSPAGEEVPQGSTATSEALPAAAESTPGAGIVVASVAPGAFGGLAPDADVVPLDPVPDAALIEERDGGNLPKTGEDGRRPWQVYAKAFQPPENVRGLIGIVVVEMGLSPTATEAAIRYLPSPITLAFDPYAQDLESWGRRAREAGHEFLVSLPMEPEGFPAVDPGPFALLTSQEPAERRERLETVMGRMAGYVGMLGLHGSRFMAEEELVTPVLTAMKWRGVLFVDASLTAQSQGPVLAAKLKLPWAKVDLALDDDPLANQIDSALANLSALAGKNGVAIAMVRPYPTTLKRLAAWIPGLKDQGLTLAPVSALAGRQALP